MYQFYRLSCTKSNYDTTSVVSNLMRIRNCICNYFQHNLNVIKPSAILPLPWLKSSPYLSLPSFEILNFELFLFDTSAEWVTLKSKARFVVTDGNSDDENLVHWRFFLKIQKCHLGDQTQNELSHIQVVRPDVEAFQQLKFLKHKEKWLNES